MLLEFIEAKAVLEVAAPDRLVLVLAHRHHRALMVGIGRFSRVEISHGWQVMLPP